MGSQLTDSAPFHLLQRDNDSPSEVVEENVVSGGPMNWSVIGEDVGFTLSAVAPVLLIAKTHVEKSAESTRSVATATL
jgi:hypothetical protein